MWLALLDHRTRENLSVSRSLAPLAVHLPVDAQKKDGLSAGVTMVRIQTHLSSDLS